jgi:glycerol-3-phosphate acyltransferase PlsX
MIILLDAMGGDNAPEATIKGAVQASSEVASSTEIWLIGDEKIIREKVKEYYNKDLEKLAPNIKIYHASESIEMEDIPTVAIRRKKDSSMVVGFNLLKEGKGDVFISAGNSGALLTGATLIVGRIRGVDRPALAGILPNANGKRLVLMDCGSNTNCKPINLLQFAQMSTIYIRDALKIEKPAIGLLNIGTEETKGNELIKDSYKLLKEYSEPLDINFVGNVEGRDAFSGKIDAIIADGFTGNIFLKTVEGMGKFIKGSLMGNLKKNIWTKICAIPSLPALNKFKKEMNYKEYGGALFLGVKQPVVKAHGSSDDYLFRFTIKQAEEFVNNKTVEKLTEQFEISNQKAEDIIE